MKTKFNIITSTCVPLPLERGYRPDYPSPLSESDYQEGFGTYSGLAI